MPEPADQERCAQHEQGVGDDGSGKRSLDENVLSGAQRGERDQKLGHVSQGGVEEAADRAAGAGRDGLGGAAEQRRQWHDRQHGENEEERVRFGLEELDDEQNRHESQQPEQRIVSDLAEQGLHAVILTAASPGGTAEARCRRSREAVN